MEWIVVIGIVIIIAAFICVWWYVHKATSIALPLAAEKKIEADFEAQKKAEAARIAGLDQGGLLEDLNRRDGR